MLTLSYTCLPAPADRRCTCPVHSIGPACCCPHARLPWGARAGSGMPRPAPPRPEPPPPCTAARPPLPPAPRCSTVTHTPRARCRGSRIRATRAPSGTPSPAASGGPRAPAARWLEKKKIEETSHYCESWNNSLLLLRCYIIELIIYHYCGCRYNDILLTKGKDMSGYL